MNRAELENLAMEKMAQEEAASAPTMPSREELELMAMEKMAQEEEPVSVNPNREASLGFVNRSRYAIEPLESNRKALLIQEFGEENVQQDRDGNVFIKQNGQFRPVNKEGFSFADVADFAGATPEVVGGLVGTAAGVVGGAGAASIPAAIGLGIAGGAAGSAARQGLSSILGTPQVANVGERVAETGMSGAFGGLGAAGGMAVKGAAKFAKPYLDDGIDGVANVFKRKPQVAQTLEQELSNTLENSSKVSINPEFENAVKYDTGEGLMSRDVVAESFKNLDDIASRQNLPRPTYAQAAGGRAIEAEGKIMETPLIGGRVRKQVDNQLKAVKNNIEKEVGKFIDEDSTGTEVGLATKDIALGIVRSTKKMSQELYGKVDELGANAMIGKKVLANKYRDTAGELGLMEPDLSRSAFAADTGLTRDEFNTLQGALFDGFEAINKNPSPKIRVQAVNGLLKTIKGTADSLDKKSNAYRILNQFKVQLEDTMEGILNREHPKLGEVYKEATRGWRKYRNDEEFLENFLPDGVENIVKKTMGNSDNVKRMKELVGEKHVKEIGRSYVRDILGGLSKSGVARADSALTAVKKNKAVIVESMGGEAYGNLVDNLYYLNRLNQPLNVSRPGLYSLLFNPASNFNLKGIAVNIATSAKTYAESKGKTGTDIFKSAAKKSSKPITVPFKKIMDAKPSTHGGLSNLLMDNSQRDGAYFTRGPAGNESREKKK